MKLSVLTTTIRERKLHSRGPSFPSTTGCRMFTRTFALAGLLLTTPAIHAQPRLDLLLSGGTRLDAPLQPPQEGERKGKKKVTLDNLPGGKGGFGAGFAAAPVTWIDDDHFLQDKSKQLLKVHALSGSA